MDKEETTLVVEDTIEGSPQEEDTPVEIAMVVDQVDPVDDQATAMAGAAQLVQSWNSHRM